MSARHTRGEAPQHFGPPKAFEEVRLFGRWTLLTRVSWFRDGDGAIDPEEVKRRERQLELLEEQNEAIRMMMNKKKVAKVANPDHGVKP